MDMDDDIKKSVIDQMMGELDDVGTEALRKPKGPVKGVEIAITVSPKGEEEMKDAMEDAGECMDPECDDPMHDHTARDAAEPPEEDNYIDQLLKKLG